MSDNDNGLVLPKQSGLAKISQAGLEVASGIFPGVGGLFSLAAGKWSEGEQNKVNEFFLTWIEMLRDEIKEKEKTVIEIMSRLDLQDEKINERVKSNEYQTLLKKGFREWAGAESEIKRTMIRNILANSAATNISSDDVVKLFLDWLNAYSELHFTVIGAIYNDNGITRGGVWKKIGKEAAREDSAEADLYKLLFRDLSTGGIIRQHRETDYYGRRIAKVPVRRPKGSGPKPEVSAFDDVEGYELTGLGQQFVHYAMTDLPPRIDAGV